MSPRAWAIAGLVLVMTIWGSTYAVTKSAVAEVPPWLFALMRFGIACAILLPLAQAQGGLSLLRKPPPLGALGLLGLTGVTIFFLCLNLGLVYTTATAGALLQGSVPACTAALATLILGERIGRAHAVGIAVSAVGVAVVVLAGERREDAPNPLLGNLLVLGSVISWSTYTVLVRRLRHAHPVAVTAYSTLAGTLMLVPAATYDLAVQPPGPFSQVAWLQALYLGTGAGAFGYLLYNHALRFLGASQVANFVNLTPVVGVLCGTLFLDEALVPLQLLGGLLVLAGVSLSTRHQAAG
jgi:drug/metabolite transporter (DMT)-like permease